jgi:hypothetical protein
MRIPKKFGKNRRFQELSWILRGLQQRKKTCEEWSVALPILPSHYMDANGLFQDPTVTTPGKAIPVTEGLGGYCRTGLD